MNHNARVLSLISDADVMSEMRKIHAAEAGIAHMLPKARHYSVKLHNVPLAAVHVLKETFLSKCGEATVHTDVVTDGVEHSDVMISATRRQYHDAFVNLWEQGFGCPEIAQEIERAIRLHDSSAVVPDTEIISDPKLSSMFEQIDTRTLVMGILNVTPDSFSDGGRFINIDTAIKHAQEMVSWGADIIDIGGESTRPGSDAVSAEEEIERVVPVICELVNTTGVPISIDTTKAKVAAAALDCGAHIVNDISGAAFDPDMPSVIAEKQCPAILMHVKGSPKDMQAHPHYDDLMSEVYAYLSERIEALVNAGADEEMLMIDPGIGFGKSIEHNLEILKRLREFKSLGRPIVIGTSRKSTVGKILGDLPTDERLEGTAATVAISIANGADIVRVHDVKEMARVAKMSDAIVRRSLV